MGRVRFFLAVIQGFMKPVFAKAKMGFVETAEKGTFSDREVGSGKKLRATASAVEVLRNAPYP